MQRIVKLCLATVLLAGTAEAVSVEKGRRRPGRGGSGRKPTGTPEERLGSKICGDDADCQAAFDLFVVSDAYTVPKQAACEAKIAMKNAIEQFTCDNDDDDTNDGDQCTLTTTDRCTDDDSE